MGVLRVVNFGTAKGGLATVGYTIYGVDGVAIGTRVTAGVVEIGTTTGIYAAPVNVPSGDCIVLWDTGEVTPRYATEDYQNIFSSILESVEVIQRIYNSIKNQGEFFAALMDRMGMLEKNTDFKMVNAKLDVLAAKKADVPLTNIEEAFDRAAKKITLTVTPPEVRLPEVKAPIVNLPAPIVNIPETIIPDYTNLISDMKGVLAEIKAEVAKVPKTQKEYAGNFDALTKMLSTVEGSLSKTFGDKAASITGEVRVLRDIFSRLDALLGKINELNSKVGQLDVNDKDLLKTKKEISDDIKRMNTYINQMTISMLSKDSRESNELIMALGHKR